MKTESARAASEIKKELKSLFPNVKFSVRSSNYSMGCSVRVEWVDGPTEKRVNKVIGKYEYGHFDGMTDMYEISNSRDDIPQAKYVFASREPSERTRTFLEDYVKKNFYHGHIKHEWEMDQFLNREFHNEFSTFHYPEKMFDLN